MASNWKTYEGYSNYAIYDEAVVYVIKTGNKVSMYKNEDGYLCLTLRSDEGKRRTFKIHRLVALVFIPNPENKPEVNHKDGNKENCAYWNLEWATHAENIQHAWNTGLLKSTPERSAKLREANGKRVICITTTEIFLSLGEACERYGLKKSNLSAVCLNKSGYRSAGKHPETGEALTWRYL